jgi:hypothetical protein
MKLAVCVFVVFAACVPDDELGELTSELNGSNPGKVTTGFGGDYVNRCVVDPIGNITNLTANPSYIMSYWSGQGVGLPYFTSHDDAQHRQSIQRLYRSGGNFLLVSMSRSPAGFEVVRMLDHTSTLRLTSAGVTPTSSPSGNDLPVRFYAGSPTRTHAGGMQVMGRFAAVPFEDGGTAYFQTFDLADPYNAVRGPTVFRQAGQTSNAGAVAMTRTDDDFFLALVFGNDSTDVEVFRSSTASLPAVGATAWVSKGAWSTGWGNAYQNVQFVTKCDGQLFVVATHQNSSEEDWADLYRVTFNTTTFKPTFAKVAKRNLTCRSSNTGNTRYCDFKAGAGPYVDYYGGIILYGIEHWNDAYPGSNWAVKTREF